MIIYDAFKINFKYHLFFNISRDYSVSRFLYNWIDRYNARRDRGIFKTKSLTKWVTKSQN